MITEADGRACKECARWFPLADYRTKPGRRQQWRDKVCKHCRNAQTRYKRANDPVFRAKVRMYSRRGYRRHVSAGSGEANARCSRCGIAYHQSKQGLKHKELFCSPECHRDTITPLLRCQQCGKGMRRPRSRPNKYCSLACRDKSKEMRITHRCAHCDKAFRAPPSRKVSPNGTIYCSKECQRHWGSVRRRRAAKAEAAAQARADAVCAGDNCAVCKRYDRRVNADGLTAAERLPLMAAWERHLGY